MKELQSEKLRADFSFPNVSFFRPMFLIFLSVSRDSIEMADFRRIVRDGVEVDSVCS